MPRSEKGYAVPWQLDLGETGLTQSQADAGSQIITLLWEDRLQVRVTLPESVLEFKMKPNSSGRQLFNQYSLSDEEWETKIAKWHEQHGDLSKQDAIMEYLKVVQDLEMYGVTYFPIKNNKQTPLWLGVDALGLNIYEQDDRLTPKINFPWNEIRKLQYSHTKFSVKPSDPSGQ
ncbi:radixin, partial [Clonorchis sinensis]